MTDSTRSDSPNLSPGALDYESNDLRVQGYDPLISPSLLRSELPVTPKSLKTIRKARQACANIIARTDDRLIVVVGPCSIHDAEQAYEYGSLLLNHLSELPDLVIIMRSYFEKPRTTIGWKGLINDPDLDGTFKINKGIRKARSILSNLTEMGLPVGVELLDTISPQFLSDMISWGAIGARTTESQLHRELTSGTSHPIGFKNGTDGGIQIAIDAIRSSIFPHRFLGVNDQGLASIVRTTGNTDVHVILRGGKKGPNYATEHVESCRRELEKARDSPAAIMIDCSHGNSQKDHRNQLKVVDSICNQLEKGEEAIIGVMMESHIHEGRQDLPSTGPANLKHGVSITDSCIDFETTIGALRKLQAAVVERRSTIRAKKVITNGVH